MIRFGKFVGEIFMFGEWLLQLTWCAPAEQKSIPKPNAIFCSLVFIYFNYYTVLLVYL